MGFKCKACGSEREPGGAFVQRWCADCGVDVDATGELVGEFTGEMHFDSELCGMLMSHLREQNAKHRYCDLSVSVAEDDDSGADFSGMMPEERRCGHRSFAVGLLPSMWWSFYGESEGESPLSEELLEQIEKWVAGTEKKYPEYEVEASRPIREHPGLSSFGIEYESGPATVTLKFKGK